MSERTIEYGHEYPHTEHLEGLKTIVMLVLGLKSSMYVCVCVCPVDSAAGLEGPC